MLSDFDDKNIQVKAYDSKGSRIIPSFTICDPNGFDKDWMKLGYIYSQIMDKDKEKGVKVKMPKKDIFVRELFNYNKKAASFHIKDYEKLDNIPNDKIYSFMRGYVSGIGYVKSSSTGYISIGLGHGLIKDNGCNLLNNIINIINTTFEPNSDTIFFQSREEISFFLEKIGFIQNEKMEKVIQLYKRKQLRVCKVIKFIENEYLHFLAFNTNNKNEYKDELLDKYDINYQDKDGNTALHLACNGKKNISIFMGVNGYWIMGLIPIFKIKKVKLAHIFY